MSLTTYREAVRTALAAALTVTFVEGKLDGPIENAALGCIWPIRVERDSAVADDELITIGVRVFQPFIPQNSPKVPTHDPDVLEVVAETIQTTIRGIRTGQGPWNQWVDTIGFDMDANMVDVVIQARQTNYAERT